MSSQTPIPVAKNKEHLQTPKLQTYPLDWTPENPEPLPGPRSPHDLYHWAESVFGATGGADGSSTVPTADYKADAETYRLNRARQQEELAREVVETGLANKRKKAKRKR